VGQESLPRPAFVLEDERDALMAAFAALVYERGYEGLQLVDIADRAGVPAERVIDHWHSTAECLLDTAGAAARHFLRRASARRVLSPDDPARATHDLLAAMLRELAAAPELTYVMLVELPRLGPLVHARQQRTLDRFGELLRPAESWLASTAPDARTTALCVVGGIAEIVREHALRRRLDELPEALPTISHFCISTFYGVDEAIRIACAPT
jgi:AcrR family transcriptional regulator